jgi:integrase
MPQDLQEALSIVELRYALKTSDIKEAAIRAARLGRFVNHLLGELRNGIRLKRSGFEMDAAHLKRIIRDYIQDMIQQDELWRMDRVKPFTWEELETESLALSDHLEDTTDALALVDLQKVKPLVDGLLRERSVTDITPESQEYKTLAMELLKANQALAKLFLARSEGDYERAQGLQDRLLGQQQTAQSADEKTPDGYKCFSEIVNLIIEENERTEAKSVRSVQDYTESNGLFIDLMGDLPLSDINHRTINDFLDKLKRWPSNRTKRPAYRDLPTAEILAMDIPIMDRISVTTINKHLSWVGHTLSYAHQRHLIAQNYCEGIRLTSKAKVRADEQREIFNVEDLQKLFHSREYLQDTFKTPFMFWLPILGLYTGARLGELCQLEVNDIQNLEGTWCVLIRPGADDDKESPASREKKRIKALSSRRSIPLHSFLLEDLKFLNYVQCMKDRGEKRLFPDVPYLRDSYSHHASKWFAKYRKRCGVDGPGKAYHSFRHTFATNLKYQEVDFQIRGELEGHATGTAITDRYQKRFKADRLKRDGIDRLDFGIDLSHLIRSRWVIR